MKNGFIDLSNFIKETNKEKSFFYLPNSGNWGDALIRHGTIKFFKENNFFFEEIFDIIEFYTELKSNKAKIAKNKILIYGGGGGWCKLWHHSPQIIDLLSPYFSKIIILPSTYELSHCKENCYYFSRDLFESKLVMPNSRFCHDMAFYLSYDNTVKGNGNGFFFRKDKESLGNKLPENNLDISLLSNHYGDLKTFFDVINPYEFIHTDRLHVAIAGAICGKKVNLYPGTYFKSRAVFESSMKKYFPKVTFCDWEMEH
jgi:CDP-glycerol glycerophosphotransferase